MQSWVVAAETLQPAKAEILTILPFTSSWFPNSCAKLVANASKGRKETWEGAIKIRVFRLSSISWRDSKISFIIVFDSSVLPNTHTHAQITRVSQERPATCLCSTKVWQPQKEVRVIEHRLPMMPPKGLISFRGCIHYGQMVACQEARQCSILITDTIIKIQTTLYGQTLWFGPFKTVWFTPTRECAYDEPRPLTHM